LTALLMPSAKGTCPICATKHDRTSAHNQTSLHYQYAFRAAFGRWPKWWDACATLEELPRQAWFTAARNAKKWGEDHFEPPPGVDAADLTEQIRAWEESIHPSVPIPMNELLQSVVVPIEDDGEEESEDDA
jgi:hypothetical protein